jgi:hypothetical protein
LSFDEHRQLVAVSTLCGVPPATWIRAAIRVATRDHLAERLQRAEATP